MPRQLGSGDWVVRVEKMSSVEFLSITYHSIAMYNLEYDRVNELFAECAYPLGEKPKGPDIIVDSISGIQFIYRKKFQKHLPEIGKMIDDPPPTSSSISPGLFSLLATRRDGTMWTGEPMVMEKFLILAMAAGLIHASPLGLEVSAEQTTLHPLSTAMRLEENKEGDMP